MNNEEIKWFAQERLLMECKRLSSRYIFAFRKRNEMGIHIEEAKTFEEKEILKTLIQEDGTITDASYVDRSNEIVNPIK